MSCHPRREPVMKIRVGSMLCILRMRVTIWRIDNASPEPRRASWGWNQLKQRFGLLVRACSAYTSAKPCRLASIDQPLPSSYRARSAGSRAAPRPKATARQLQGHVGQHPEIAGVGPEVADLSQFVLLGSGLARLGDELARSRRDLDEGLLPAPLGFQKVGDRKLQSHAHQVGDFDTGASDVRKYRTSRRHWLR